MGDPGEPRDRRQPPALDIPDLELPPPRPSQSGLRAVQVAPSAPPVRISSPAPFDDDDVAVLGPSLDLDLHSPISSGQVAAHGNQGFGADDFELEAVGSVLEAVGASSVELGGHWPSGETPDRARVRVDPNEARALAGFGEAPGFFATTPVYALRVVARRRALMKALRELERETADTTARRDALLAHLAESVRPALERSERFRAMLAPIAALAAAASERGSAVAAREAELANELGARDRDIAARRAEHDALRGALDEAARHAAAAEHACSRVEAQLKRARIEMRGIEQQAVARGAREGDALHPELAAQMLPLREKEALLAGELETARAAEQAARRAHDAAAQRAREAHAVVAGLERDRAGRVALAHRSLENDSRGLREAETARTGALADVGRAVLKARGDVPVDAATLASIQAADDALLAVVQRSELHLAALDSCDADKVKTGWVVLGVALCAVLGVAIWFVAAG